MESMIREMYENSVGFSRRHGLDSAFVQMAQVKSDNLDKLMASLNEAEKEWFDQYCGAESEIEEIIRYDAYCSALRFAIRLMMEVLLDRDESV